MNYKELSAQDTSWKHCLFPTAMGWVALLASHRGIRTLTLQPTPQEALAHLGHEVERSTEDLDSLRPLREAIEEYFRGKADALQHLPVDLEGASPFFTAIWEACRTIPPGQTRSYAWLAEAAGRPRAYRAVGQAMARNRAALVIPCHRVIGSNGGLHGYGMGGLEVKARLLALERSSPTTP